MPNKQYVFKHIAHHPTKEANIAISPAAANPNAI